MPNVAVPFPSALAFDDPLPTEVDVVIIGAGIIGISTAWYLAARGLSVAICDKGLVAGEQSSRNWGWIRQHGRDRAELPLMMDSIEQWQTIAAELGQDIGFSRDGVYYLASNRAELDAREAWLAVAKDYGLDSRMLTADQLSNHIQGNPGHWLGACYTPGDGRAEPHLAVPAIARALQKKRVTIREHCAARCLETSAGKVSAVITEHGEIRCRAAVCAGGAWSSLFSRHHGCDFPLLTVRATVARTAAAPDFFRGNAASSSLSFRRRLDGGYTLAAVGFMDHYLSGESLRYGLNFLSCWKSAKSQIAMHLASRDANLYAPTWPAPRWSASQTSPFERQRILNPPPSSTALAKIRRQLSQQLPALSHLAITQSWAGMIDATPDVVPVIDEAPQLPGYYIAAGFSGHGFGIGPGVGRILASKIVNDEIEHDLSRFRLSRFSDGSKRIPGPAL